jgi:hypothetical protein
MFGKDYLVNFIDHATEDKCSINYQQHLWFITPKVVDVAKNIIAIYPQLAKKGLTITSIEKVLKS